MFRSERDAPEDYHQEGFLDLASSGSGCPSRLWREG